MENRIRFLSILLIVCFLHEVMKSNSSYGNSDIIPPTCYSSRMPCDDMKKATIPDYSDNPDNLDERFKHIDHLHDRKFSDAFLTHTHVGRIPNDLGRKTQFKYSKCRRFCAFVSILFAAWLYTTIWIAFPHNAHVCLDFVQKLNYYHSLYWMSKWIPKEKTGYLPVDLDNLTRVKKWFKSLDKRAHFSHFGDFSYNSFQNVDMQIYPFSATNAFLINKRANSAMIDEEMIFEVRRLQSFNRSPVRASSILLAQSGFYATGKDDETRCFSCKVNYRNWQMMDKPDIVHRNISPDCPHLNRRDARNVPIHSENDNCANVNGLVETYPQVTSHASIRVTESREDSNEEATAASASSTSADGQNSEDTSTNLDISQAVYPQYRDQQSRLDSYHGWGYSLVQDPNVLTGAGFYYAGYRDCVRCFYCGVGLRTWEREDDPWVEHVRWRSSCDYVKCMKGEQYIIEALTKGSQSGPVLPPAAGSSHSHKMPGVTQRKEGRPKHVIAKAVEMGFTREESERTVAELIQSQKPQHGAGEITGQNDVNGIQLETLIEKLLLSHEETTAKHLAGKQRTLSGISTQQPREPTSLTVLFTANGDDPIVSAILPEGTRGRPEGHSLGSESLIHGDVSWIPTKNIQQTGLQNSKHDIGENDKRNIQAKSWQNNTAPELPRPLSPSLQRQLEEENQSLRDDSTCKVCLDNPSCIVFLPCGHLVTCAECAPALRKCPVCRALIRGTVRAYMD